MPADIKKTEEIIDLLTQAYNDEIETVANYLANSVNLEGVRAERIKQSLAEDVNEELGHAQMLAKRIHVLGGTVPGSQKLKWRQDQLQPPADSTAVIDVIKGVIDAEEQAIEGYENIIRACEGVDYATQDLAITLLTDEQEHRREFVGYLKEYEKGSNG